MEFVKVGSGTWAGRYEVTQGEYQKVMGSNPSHFSGRRNPVDSVTYDDAVEFCQRLTEQELKDMKLPEGFSYTLPTEGQWEGLVADATRAQAVTSENGSRSGTSPVGSLAPNSLGLYDVRGNVMEFCLGSAMPYRVLRGGSWQDWIDVNLRLSFRYYAQPDERKDTFGFRCLLVQSGKKQ
jgi:formylglycine-generating enzyme required for sulfatase activity